MKRAPLNSEMGVKKAKHPGDKAGAILWRVLCDDARGLYLQITPNGSKSWIVRYQVDGKRRDHGLGPYPAVTLSEARAKAREVHSGLPERVDPIEARKREAAERIAAEKSTQSFAEAVEAYLSTPRVQNLKNEKNKAQRRSMLETYAIPIIGDMLVGDVGTDDIKRVLAPIWNAKREMARKLSQWLAQVIDDAVDDGFRSADAINPAGAEALKSWRRKQGEVEGHNQPAVPVERVAAWFKALRKHHGAGANALEFLALTAVRSGEVREMVWSEVDMDGRVWIIPAARMKMKREHRVPLSAAAMAVLSRIERREGVEYVFPNARDGALSYNALSNLMRDMHNADVKAGRKGWVDRASGRPAVPHGLRSTFKDWAAERTTYPNEMSEIALAHSVGTAVEQKYRRTDMMERRRAMMDAWADFLDGKAAKSGKVVQLNASAA